MSCCRCLLRGPELIWGWWIQYVAKELQDFYDDFIAGKRPKLALMAPPQHGKSWTATDFMAWVAGKNPDLKIIFGSYSDKLGARTNMDLQRIFRSENYQNIFPGFSIGEHGWACNTEVIEFCGHKGSFRNTTVDGQVNGMELNLGVIDDPVKGRAEAFSELTRDRTWHWFTTDFGSRFAENSAMLIIMTRWHVDDLLGRYLEREHQVKVLRFPAVAERGDQYRHAGEPLFPELKSEGFLEERRRILTESEWQAVYQQTPIIVGGGIFPIDKIKTEPYWGGRDGIIRSVRFWDKARDGRIYGRCAHAQDARRALCCFTCDARKVAGQ